MLPSVFMAYQSDKPFFMPHADASFILLTQPENGVRGKMLMK